MAPDPSFAWLLEKTRTASHEELQALLLANLSEAERDRLARVLREVESEAPTLPLTLEEVDYDFVTSALRHQGHIEQSTSITSWTRVQFERKKGYMGDKCLLRDLVYEPIAPQAPSSIFVKLFPTDPFVPVSSCARMWHTEVDFVTRILKTLPESSKFKAPQIYFAESCDADGTQPRFVILMENIEAKPYDISRSMPVEHAFRAATDLAILHAPYWGWDLARYRDEKDVRGHKMFEAYGHLDDAGKKESFQGLFQMGAKIGPEIFGPDGPLSPAQREEFSGYVEFWSYWSEIWPTLQKRWKALFARWSSIPATLAHGDLHVENMFCLEDQTNVYIDFQAANLGPGVRDLAWLLASSLKAEVRREHEKAILRAYREALLTRGVDYAWEKCWDDFVLMKIHGLFAGCLGAGIFAAKNFKEKTGIFAETPSEDALLERSRNCVLFSQVVDDLRHSAWLAMIQAFPEGPIA